MWHKARGISPQFEIKLANNQSTNRYITWDAQKINYKLSNQSFQNISVNPINH